MITIALPLLFLYGMVVEAANSQWRFKMPSFRSETARNHMIRRALMYPDDSDSFMDALQAI